MPDELVMTPEQKLDRLERMVRLLYEAILRDSRETRKQTAKWKTYLTADREHEAARIAATENPQDSEAINRLRRAKESRQKAREELRQSTELRHPSTLDGS
jgi:hypothetical protein